MRHVITLVCVHAAVQSSAGTKSPLHVKEKCNTEHAVFQHCSLPKPITVKCSLSYLRIPLQASWQVKWEGSKGRTSEVKWQVKWEESKGRTSEGNILINYSICNNAGRSGNSSGNNSFRYHVNLVLWRLRINKENNGPCIFAKQKSCEFFPFLKLNFTEKTKEMQMS